jgi:hypothetical protein
MELNHLFLRYNLRNTVLVPTTITKSTSKLLNVIIINKKNYTQPTIVMDLELSNHYAQVLSTPFKNFNMPQESKEDNFREENVQQFLYLQNQVTWQEVYIESDRYLSHLFTKEAL